MAKTKSTQTGIEINLLDADGNIFSIMARAIKAMKRQGFGEEAKQMAREVKTSPSYAVALAVVSRYVVTELTE